jgi:hypothetical protein
MGYVERLARDLESRWRRKNYDEDWFPELATAALRESPADSQLDPAGLLAQIPLLTTLPFQPSPRSDFGEPPLTLYYSEKFYFELLFWFDGTTAIHQHGFSGAFQVVQGSSIHSVYTFERQRRVSSRMALGRIALERIEWLQRGDIRPILSGDRLIHALFHLDRPSITLVVRTVSERDRQPQFNYLKPSLAIDTFSDDVLMRRKLQCLEALRKMGSADYAATLRRVLGEADFHTALVALQQHARADDAAPSVDELLVGMRERHGELCDSLPAMLRESRRQDVIKRRRNRIVDADHRFLLACLLNAPDREAVLELVRRRAGGGDPLALITAWIEQLSRLPSPENSAEPNALGIPMHDDELHVVRKLVRGLSNREILAELAGEFDSADVRAREAEIVDYCDHIRASDLFSTLFVRRP